MLFARLVLTSDVLRDRDVDNITINNVLLLESPQKRSKCGKNMCEAPVSLLCS